MRTWLVASALVVTAAGGMVMSAPAPPRYDDYRAVLMAFVDTNGLVDYQSLQTQRSDLDDFVSDLSRQDPAIYATWSEKDRLAYWINAYNALTLKTIVYHYPIPLVTRSPNGAYPKNSIRQISGAWDLDRVNVMGQSMTLGYIEAKILRHDFHDPRFRVALASASVSGPILRNEPYEGAKLDAQLDDQARRFLENSAHFHIDRQKKEVRVSEIFRMYAQDFAPKDAPSQALTHAGLVAFASRYLNDSDRAFLAGNDYSLIYAPYDWTLNEQPR